MSAASPQWREQYDRMWRRAEHVLAVKTLDETRDGYNERVTDNLHAFFLTCWHLSDWIEKDASTGVPKGAAASYARSQVWLKRCELVALGSKHAVLFDGRAPSLHK